MQLDSINKQAVVKLFEEHRERYRLTLTEKNNEIQHWIRKYKRDTEVLQGILEEQERVEVCMVLCIMIL